MNIPEREIEGALAFMRNNAKPLAKAKAERIYLEQYRKTKKAILVQEASGTVQERESYAYAHPEYVEVLEGIKAAVEEEERLKWLMTAAQAKVEVWRSLNANARRVDGAHV